MSYYFFPAFRSKIIFLHDSGWITDGKGIRGNRFDHIGHRSDNASVADGYSRKDTYRFADPYIVSDFHRTGMQRPLLVRNGHVERMPRAKIAMIQIGNAAFGTYAAIAADTDMLQSRDMDKIADSRLIAYFETNAVVPAVFERNLESAHPPDRKTSCQTDVLSVANVEREPNNFCSPVKNASPNEAKKHINFVGETVLTNTHFDKKDFNRNSCLASRRRRYFKYEKNEQIIR